MKYNFNPIRVVRLVIEDIKDVSINWVDTEYFPRYEIYPQKNSKFIFKLLIRWTLRFFINDTQILGYVSEHDVFIDYATTEDNKEDNITTLRNIFSTSQLNSYLKFSELSSNSILKDVSTPAFLIKEEDLKNIIYCIEERIQQQE